MSAEVTKYDLAEFLLALAEQEMRRAEWLVEQAKALVRKE